MALRPTMNHAAVFAAFFLSCTLASAQPADAVDAPSAPADTPSDDDGPPDAQPAGLLGELDDESAKKLFGMGGVGALTGDTLDSAVDSANEKRAIERYMANMLWLDETRIATDSGSHVREYRFLHGVDKREVDLDTMLQLAGADDELEAEEAARSFNFITISVPVLGLLALSVIGALAGMAGFGLIVAPSLGVGSILPASSPIPLATTVSGFVVFGMGLLGALGVRLLGDSLWAKPGIQEHDLRRVVREHNTRLLDEYGVKTRRDDIPTGVPE